MENSTVKLLTKYKHFKGNLYKVVDVALHCENLEEYVVYKSLDNEKTWIRSKIEFLSEVDHEKYPEITQKYRFELQK